MKNEKGHFKTKYLGIKVLDHIDSYLNKALNSEDFKKVAVDLEKSSNKIEIFKFILNDVISDKNQNNDRVGFFKQINTQKNFDTNIENFRHKLKKCQQYIDYPQEMNFSSLVLLLKWQAM